MRQTFRVVTWSCRRASLRSGLWDYLLELDPDVALLQHFGAVPERVLHVHAHLRNAALVEGTDTQRHKTGILIKGVGTEDLPLPAPADWVARELEHFQEYFTAKVVTLHNGVILKALSVYSPWFPIERTRLEGIDTTGIRLTAQRRDLWVSELLWATL